MGVPLLLDVDGVVSPLPDVRVDARRPRRHLAADGYYANIFVYEDVAERLGRLHATGLVDIRWTTSWEDGARDSLAPRLGWPAELTTHRHDDHPDESWWKAGPARTLWEAGESFIWVDDDLRRHAPAFIVHGPRHELERKYWEPDVARYEPFDFGSGVIAHTPGLLAIAPERHVGLTPEHLDAIESFARTVRA